MASVNDLIIPEFYLTYVNPVIDEELVPGLIRLGNESLDLYRSINEKASEYSYDEGKWSIKEVLSHIIDAERVFAYRALAFSRNDNNVLPGFDQELYVQNANAGHRKFHKIIEEFGNVRASTIDFFSDMPEDMLSRAGTASGAEVSVRALGYIILGHAYYHQQIIKSRYLK